MSPEELNTIKYVAVNNAEAAVDRCLRMVGGHGIYRKLPLERYDRDVRAGSSTRRATTSPSRRSARPCSASTRCTSPLAAD